jgi:uracil-DNA glycosylase
VNARVLFLLEAPGPKAAGTTASSGFVSSNNPDPTAENLWDLIHNAGIARADTLIWNIVPWYVGENGHIKPAPKEDIKQALPHLKALLDLLPRLNMLVLVGRKAQSAKPQIHRLTVRPIRHTYHMSARVFYRWPEKKKQTEEDFGKISTHLNDSRHKESGI